MNINSVLTLLYARKCVDDSFSKEVLGPEETFWNLDFGGNILFCFQLKYTRTGVLEKQ